MFRIFVVVIALMVGSIYAVESIQQSGVMAPKKTAAKQVQPRKTVEPGRVVIPIRGGHYVTEASVDGHELHFLVDTGATLIALRASDATDLGYRPSEEDYRVIVSTANGQTIAAPVQLSIVDVGGITVGDVKALVMRDDALNVNVLGMSFLSKVRWTQEDGELVLEQ
jgi:aspartyl protease family protein